MSLPRGQVEDFWKAHFGPLFKLTGRGFTVHRLGKSFYRTSWAKRGKIIPLHGFKNNQALLMGQMVLDDLRLRHFDALSFVRWLNKHISRIDGRVHAAYAGNKRVALARHVFDRYQQNHESAKAIHEKFMLMPKDRIATGIELGALIVSAPLK